MTTFGWPVRIERDPRIVGGRIAFGVDESLGVDRGDRTAQQSLIGCFRAHIARYRPRRWIGYQEKTEPIELRDVACSSHSADTSAAISLEDSFGFMSPPARRAPN